MQKKGFICFLVIVLIFTLMAGCNEKKPLPTEVPSPTAGETPEALDMNVTPVPGDETDENAEPTDAPDAADKEGGSESLPTAKPTEKPTAKPTAKPADPTLAPMPTLDVGDGIVLPDDVW